MKYLKILSQIFLFILLTALTQMGGIILLLSLWVAAIWKLNFPFKHPIIFLELYLFSTFFIVPFLAPFFGREKVKHSETIQPTNYMTVILNRNYVSAELNLFLAEAEKNLEGTEIMIHYLDANFPFINNFPLLPHLSHNDGKKIDLSLIYENKKGEISTGQKSFSGYGVFEAPKNNESNQTKKCKLNGYFQYDYPKYVTFGNINSELQFSKKGTKLLINTILKNEILEKLFIEPHLKNRLQLSDSRIRYHGCKAVRHDDHIHMQVK